MNSQRYSQDSPYPARFALYVSQFTVFFLFFIGGLAGSRILYEWVFPSWLWLARPPVALLVATIIAFSGWIIWARGHIHSLTTTSWSPSPLLLNLLYLADPTVDLIRSRLLFFASLWLITVFTSQKRLSDRSWRWAGVLLVIAALLPIYLLTMPDTVGQADTFEFQVVAPKLGIAHPTGYPLYLILGKLFTLIPFQSVAWRLNFGSAVFAIAALSCLYLLLYRLWQRPLPALFGAVVTGLTVTFWRQAIEAEVYALHVLIVVAALWLMREIGDWRQEIDRGRLIIILAFVIGLGLTNHLTTVFLIPPAILAVFFAWQSNRQSTGSWPDGDTGHSQRYQLLLKLLVAFLVPLLLYAYLPLRWQTVNGEAMGFGRFVDWVIGGRFQGALQWDAWLRDPTRYGIVGRLFLDNWGWFNLLIVLLGFVILFHRQRRFTAVLLLTWSGYTFYCLNYYVPDLSVFLLPAQVVVGIGWAAGVMGLLEIGGWKLEIKELPNLQSLISSLLLIPTLLLATANWPQVNRAQDDALTTWGTGVLNLPLAEGAAILADSEKIAPLFYLQQAENRRPDLDIMVLPDEAAYRAELDARIAAGQTVYLARFLPGLQGIYHLRSVGPLTEVSTRPLTTLPETVVPTHLNFGPIQLLGYELEPEAAINQTETAVTFYWQATGPVSDIYHVHTRWTETAPGGKHQRSWTANSQHPANNNYPTAAWKADEIVSDFHHWPRPILVEATPLALQVALASPFTSPDELAWQTITTVDFAPSDKITLATPYRAQIGDSVIETAAFPAQIRPQTPLPFTFSGHGRPHNLEFSLQPNPQSPISNPQSPISNLRSPVPNPPFTAVTDINTDLDNGRYHLIAAADTGAICGWMQPTTQQCLLGEVEISGVPLPANATNYEDKIALLDVRIPDKQLQPGGQVTLDLTWQGLAPMTEDYTVFVQILDAQDRLVGQVDSWPVQGTYPTSQWSPGETINDPYVVQLSSDMPSGAYRLHVGLYLLGTLRRLPVLNEDGLPIDDKFVLSGLVVP